MPGAQESYSCFHLHLRFAIWCLVGPRSHQQDMAGTFQRVPEGQPDHWVRRRILRVICQVWWIRPLAFAGCMLNCWPGALQSSRESVSARRKQLWLAIAANEFLLGGKHWLHLWAPRSLGKAQATQSFLRNFTLKLRIWGRSHQWERKGRHPTGSGLHRWWGAATCPLKQVNAWTSC